MTIPNYIIKQNPKQNPTYPYARTEYYFELLDGEFRGTHFNFGEINIIENKEITFDYNLLYIPDAVTPSEALREIIAQILLQTIERGYYELDAK